MPVIAEYLSHNGSHTTLGQRATFSDEQAARFHRRPRFQVGLQRTPGRKGKRDRPLLVAFPQTEDHGAATFRKHQVVQFQGNRV